MAKKPTIISVANSKGGVGKSLVSIMLSVALAKDKKKKVLIIDCDNQGSVRDMYESEKENYEQDPAIEVEELTPRKVQTFLKRFGGDYDYVFIDVPRMTDAKKDNATIMLLYNCDCILIPVIGSEVDVLSTLDFLTIVQEAAVDKKEMGEDLKYFGFINRRNQRKSNEEFSNFMSKQKLKMFNNSLYDLRIFTEPSFHKSLLESAEGKRRFGEFYKEFLQKFKL